MIVRVLGEGQFRINDDVAAEANRIDERVQRAVDTDDDAAFSTALAELVELVSSRGQALTPEEFVGSDAVVPGPDTTLAQARELLQLDGLIPD